MKMKKFTRFTYINLRILLGIVFVISIVGIFLNDDHSIKSDYMFNAAQSGAFLIVSLLPMFLKKIDLEIPDFIYLMFILFMLAHFVCGEILGFFVKIKWWDSLLHTFSGMFIALLSFSLIHLLNRDRENGFKASVGFVMIFAFCVALTIGVLWEIVEYACDCWFGLNMQRAYVSTMSGRGDPLLGQDALADTMKDLMLDSIGALVVCVVCAICVMKNKVRLEDLTFIKKRVTAPKHLDVVVAEAIINQENKDELIVKNTNEQKEELFDNKDLKIEEIDIEINDQNKHETEKVDQK